MLWISNTKSAVYDKYDKSGLFNIDIDEDCTVMAATPVEQPKTLPNPSLANTQDAAEPKQTGEE